MPELPEVETVMRGLRPVLDGRRIVRVAVNRADLRWPFPDGLGQALTRARVIGLARRAKYILVRLDTGRTLMMHLGMSGRMTIGQDDPATPVAHEHFVIWTDAGDRVALVDPRRFGSVDLMATEAEAAHRLLAPLGPEPLGDAFDAATLSAALVGRRTPIKSALLDQTVVAGLGNIYVCEALFAAQISPRRLAASVAGARAARLVPAVQTVLREAIAAGGSSLRDYVQPSGELGYFQHAWRVYGREGEPCPRCPGAPACAGVVRIAQAGRSTFYCPRTQR